MDLRDRIVDAYWWSRRFFMWLIGKRRCFACGKRVGPGESLWGKWSMTGGLVTYCSKCAPGAAEVLWHHPPPPALNGEVTT